MPGAGSVGSLGGSDMPEEESENEEEGDQEEIPGGPAETEPEPSKKGGGFGDSAKDAFKKEKEKLTKKRAKKGLKKAAGKTAEKALEKGAEKAAGTAAGTAAGAALGSVLPVIGNILGSIAGKLGAKLLFDKRVHIALIAILLLIILIIVAPAGGLALSYMEGGLTGGTPKMKTDLSNPAHTATINKIERYTQLSGTGACGKRLEFADPKDLELIKKGEVDYRILLAIEKMVSKNDHIKISHVMNLMSKIPANTIETHSDVQNQYLDNESAHKIGMAFDVTEINCVNKYCACNNNCGCDKIPVQVVWQSLDDTNGIARETGLGQISEILGLPDGSLNGNDLTGIFQSTGSAELERMLGLPSGSLGQSNDLMSFIKAYGQADIEAVIGLPLGSLKPQSSLSAYASETGRRALEEVLRLPKGSLTGSQPSAVFKNTGERSIEEELNLGYGSIINHPEDAYNQLHEMGLSANDKHQIENYLGWPSGTISNLTTNLRHNDIAGTNSVLSETGKNVLEQAFGVPSGSLESGGSIPFSPSQGLTKDHEYGLPSGTFETLFSSLKNGESINPVSVNVGGRKLDYALNLDGGSIDSIIDGRKTPDQILAGNDEDYYNSYLGNRLNISDSEARDLKKAILKGQNINPQITKVGVSLIEKNFNLKTGTLTSLINGQINADTFLDINGSALKDMAESLRLNYQTLSQLFNGSFNAGLEGIGQEMIAQVFGFDIGQLTSWAKSFDVGAIIQNEVIKTVAGILGIDASILGAVLTGNIDPASLISLGASILIGGPLGGIFGGIFGGVLGGNCTTNCYKDEAIQNIRSAISQLLDMGPNFKPIQIITFRQADVDYFRNELNLLYGENRQPNYGLFARKEMRGHIHIGY